MNRIAMSPAAAAMLRSLLARASVARDRILLTEVESVDWQSLTFIGERHVFRLRIPGPNSAAIADQLCEGLDGAEFAIPGQIVADVAVLERAANASDGSVGVAIEALTIADS